MNCCCEVTTSDAGDDQVIGVNSTTLDGNQPTVGCGRWTVVSGSGVFTNRKRYNTTVTVGLGINVFLWRISLDCKACPCAEYSEDTVTITYSVSSPSSSISSSASSSESSSSSSSISSSRSSSTSSSVSSSPSSSGSSSISSSPSE